MKSNTYSPWRRRRLPRSVSRNTASLDFETSCRDLRRIFACSPWSLTPRRCAKKRPGQRMGLLLFLNENACYAPMMMLLRHEWYSGKSRVVRSRDLDTRCWNTNNSHSTRARRLNWAGYTRTPLFVFRLLFSLSRTEKRTAGGRNTDGILMKLNLPPRTFLGKVATF